jgi:hypothetical protein
MWTKSKIQLIQERYTLLNNYKEGLENLLEKYNIEDNIFTFKNGQIFEASKGYFVKKGEYKSLTEALNNCNYSFDNVGIRIINNDIFELGEIKYNLSECNVSENKVYDINKVNYI